MTEVEFYQLLQRYLDGRATPDEQARVAQWYEQLPPAGVDQPAPPPKQVVETAIWQRLQLPPAAPAPRVRQLAPRWRQKPVRWAAAAAVLALTLGGLLPLARHWQATPAPTAATGWQHYHNTTKQLQVLRLPDATRVTLHPGSHLRYAGNLAGARREVYLEGEAFFEVHKDPRHPFLVLTKQLVTTVLGTSFDVKAYPGSAEAQVAVREGKVAVQPRAAAQLDATPTHPAKTGVLLLPNQQVVYSMASHHLHKKLVDKPVVLVPQAFEFEERPVAEVLAALEKAYGVDIQYDQQKLAGCTVSITFYNESLFDKLDLLCKSLGASYSQADTRITIHSRGCQASPVSPPG